MLEAFDQTLLLCAFRGLPFAVYACVARAFSLRGKVIALGVYGAVFAGSIALRGAHTLSWVVVGNLYYLACATLVPRCAVALRERRVTAGALFVVFATAYVVAPNIALTPAQAQPFFVLGWDLLLSSYSYCYDLQRREPCSLSQCLFFLFVDPTLTYATRSRHVGVVGQQRGAAARVALGIFTLFIANAVLRPVRALSLGGIDALPNVVALSVFAATCFVLQYASHSGLASLQIGLMRHCGYVSPERYVRPWLARDPEDFWRRWNTYVTGWLRRYIFLPLSRRALAGSRNRAARVFPRLGTVLATLLLSGLLHDGFTYLETRTISLRMVGLFATCGVAVLLYMLARYLMHGRAARSRWLRSSLAATCASAAARAYFVAALLGVYAVWG